MALTNLNRNIVEFRVIPWKIIAIVSGDLNRNIVEFRDILCDGLLTGHLILIET